jgi:putative addiction module component (TIGR02574 family)
MGEKETAMSPVLAAFGLDKLSVPERLLLVDELWDSIAVEEEQVPLTEAQKSDLQRRLDAIDADPSRGSSWSEVKARLMGSR